MRVKSITLTGTEYKVNGLDGTNALVINNSDSSIYASRLPNVEPYADNVIEIKPGTRDTVEGANGTVYVLGTGNIECRGVSYVNFRSPSSFSGNGGGNNSDVSKAYVDEQDRTNLIVAKAYTDVTIEAVVSDIAKNEDKITELQSNLEDANSAISENRSLVTSTANSTLTNANDYTDTKTDELNVEIKAVQSAISVLNGTDTGSVSKTVAEQIAAIIANAPEDLDTLKEIADWISEHADDAAAMNSAILTNTTSISSIQKDLSDVQETILQDKAETDSNMETLTNGLTNLVISKADKSEIPTTLPANGGDANTVNGHTVNADVPADAQFTDTTYTVATPSTDGLESKEDKAKLDGIEDGANNYILPVATPTGLGGVKIGDNLSVTADGTLSAPIYSNPNLLDNPDFKINQRGETEYTTAGYTVDRWKKGAKAKATVNDNSNLVLISQSGVSGDSNLYQLIEEYNALRGQKVCFSAKINGTVRYMTCVLPETNSSYFAKELSFDGGKMMIFTVNINIFLGVYIITTSEQIPLNIEWTKLELGSAPTPFVPPAPAEELTKCLRYYEKGIYRVRMLAPSQGFNQWFTGISCAVPKRILPTFKLLNIKRYDSTNVNDAFFNDIATVSIAANSNDPLRLHSGDIPTNKGTIEEGAMYTVEYIASADL